MFLDSLNIAGSGLSAERLRMDVISQNLANVDTTKGADGLPYIRKTVTFQERTQNTFDSYLNDAQQGPGGVEVSAIGEDPSALKLEYDPSDPNANAQGYVQLPNIDTVTEMSDLMEASKSYSADITAFNAVKDITSAALQIGK
jgi:flagellar basal-body rod protein FlgC